VGYSRLAGRAGENWWELLLLMLLLLLLLPLCAEFVVDRGGRHCPIEPRGREDGRKVSVGTHRLSLAGTRAGRDLRLSVGQLAKDESCGSSGDSRTCSHEARNGLHDALWASTAEWRVTRRGKTKKRSLPKRGLRKSNRDSRVLS
jgi:hypothetical protein